SIFIYKGTRFFYANPASEQITGYTREELLTKSVTDMIHPDFRQMIAERSAARQGGQLVPERYEFKVIRKDGAERWVDFSAGLIQLEGETAVLGTCTDITEKKNAERALAQSEQRFRSLVQSSDRKSTRLNSSH